MFASWSKARRTSIVAASAAAVGILASSPVLALEGIQGRHAIFYPSLELVYQHDDNYFLTPDNEVSAETFIAHAHFAVEVPGQRQYLRFEYAPQWRNVNVSKNAPFELEDETSHFWNLLARLKGSSVFGVDIRQDLTLGALEVLELDPNREFVLTSGERFMRHNIDADFNWTGSRQGATVSIGKEDTDFDDTIQAPPWYELDAWRMGTEYHWKFAPLTKWLVGFKHQNSTQDYTPALTANTGIATLDSNADKLYFGFEGEMGRTTTGRAELGFLSLDYDGGGRNSDWDGIVMRADVTKGFSRFTKLNFNAERMANGSGFAQSATELNTYYISNRASFTLANQPQGSKVGWELLGSFQRNGYDAPATDSATGVVKEREDDITRMRAMVGFHPLEHLSFRLNYQWEERESNFAEFDYVDNLVIFQVQFGF